jgi:hypothetical protein
VLANVYDKLDLTVTDADGDSTRLVRWSNMDEQDYTLETIPLGAYAGQTITLTLTGDETGNARPGSRSTTSHCPWRAEHWRSPRDPTRARDGHRARRISARVRHESCRGRGNSRVVS